MSLVCKLSGHKWNGCTCARCGERRNEEHDWSAFEYQDKRYHKRVCKICGAAEKRFHTFQMLPGCVQKCDACGFEQPAHQWDGCVCTNCGATRDMPKLNIPVYGSKGSVITRRLSYPREDRHKGPWVPEGSHPCLIVCEACGKKAWDHDLVLVDGQVGVSSGGGSTINFGGGFKCRRCGEFVGNRGNDYYSG